MNKPTDEETIKDWKEKFNELVRKDFVFSSSEGRIYDTGVYQLHENIEYFIETLLSKTISETLDRAITSIPVEKKYPVHEYTRLMCPKKCHNDEIIEPTYDIYCSMCGTKLIRNQLKQEFAKNEVDQFNSAIQQSRTNIKKLKLNGGESER